MALTEENRTGHTGPTTLAVPRWADHYLAMIRPEIRATSLVQRVVALLPVGTSSACQRLPNAATHDLKKKVVVAGLDIAQQDAADNRLPPVAKADDVEDYSTSQF